MEWSARSRSKASCARSGPTRSSPRIAPGRSRNSCTASCGTASRSTPCSWWRHSTSSGSRGRSTASWRTSSPAPSLSRRSPPFGGLEGARAGRRRASVSIGLLSFAAGGRGHESRDGIEGVARTAQIPLVRPDARSSFSVEPPMGPIEKGATVQTRLGTTPASSFQLRLKARPDSAFLLRARLSLWLGELGARRDEVFDVALAVSEAFANAVEHPHEPTARRIEVEGCFADGTITVTLRDFGTWGEERQREEGGYG